MPASLAECRTDDEVFEYLGQVLEARLPVALLADYDAFVTALRAAPPGFRAMAAIYELDVSMTLDDLGWHFANWHHWELCQETARGLWELEAIGPATWFDQALQLVQPYWEQIGALLAVDFQQFIEWYTESPLSAQLEPLNEKFYELSRVQRRGLLQYWIDYARKYPERLA